MAASSSRRQRVICGSDSACPPPRPTSCSWTTAICRALSISLETYCSSRDHGREEAEALIALPGLWIEKLGGSLDERYWHFSATTSQYEIFVPDAAGAQDDAGAPTWTAICRKPRRSEDTSSEGATAWAARKLAQCRSEHAGCGKGCSDQRPPARVLDLDAHPSDGGLSSDLRLWEASGPVGDYVCLSHCWGDPAADPASRPLQTKSESLGRFKERIEFAVLPKTFRDAVVFTRRMGIRFLWIDPLCIVQDSQEDWAREAGKMAGIYQNAALTLSATSSADSRGGLFRAKQTTAGLGVCDPDGRPVYIREFPDPYFFDTHHHIGTRALGRPVSPPAQRAWVFQERLLSPRTLFFCPTELAWECRCSADAESGQPFTNHEIREHVGFALPGREEDTGADKSRRWRSLVYEYTRLDLTFQRDMPPAIAGVARLVQHATGSEYLAGLWRDTFLSDLLWTRVDNKRSRPQRVPGIPSWSWACVGARVGYGVEAEGEEEGEELCGLQDVVVRASSKGDAFLEVDSGRAVISGHLIPLAACHDAGQVRTPSGNVSSTTHPDYDWRFPGPSRIVEGDRLYALPVLASKKDAGKNRDYHAKVKCLVLGPVEQGSDEKQGGTFERAGIFALSLLAISPGAAHVFGGSGFYASALEQYIRHGESLLDGQGRYEDGARRAWDPFVQAAIKAASDSGRGYEAFSGTPHLEMLRGQLAAEKARLEEWRRCGGKDVEHPPVTVTIV